jgi:arylsulfatase
MPDGTSGSVLYLTGSDTSSGALCSFKKVVAEAAQSFIEFPPMQKGATFNMEAVKAEIEKAIAAQRHSE